jgi:aspartate kinase
MALIVHKYGGTSVQDLDRIRHVASRVAAERARGHDLVVVVSAMGKSTDALVALMAGLTAEPSGREMDMLLATGEQVSIALVAQALLDRGVPAVSLTGWQAGIRTEGRHRDARIVQIDPVLVRQHLSEGRVVVVAGFQGWTAGGAITTLGRGGSDTTAVALAAALGADRCDIFTDVDGVYTTDPREVPAARRLESISYDEMLELASLGAKVLHPRSVEAAIPGALPFRVRSTFDDGPGTLVTRAEAIAGTDPVRGVTLERGRSLLRLVEPGDSGWLTDEITRAWAEAGLSPVRIETVDRSLAWGFSAAELPVARRVAIERVERDEVQGFVVEPDLARVSVVGTGLATSPGLEAALRESLADRGVRCPGWSRAPLHVACWVGAREAQGIARLWHDILGLDRLPAAGGAGTPAPAGGSIRG